MNVKLEFPNIELVYIILSKKGIYQLTYPPNGK